MTDEQQPPSQPRPADEWLILVPTELERAQLGGALGPDVELAGFGPIAAAASAAAALAERRPARVLLVGIAGSFDPLRFPLGSALDFGEVACCGVGAGPLTPSQLGFPQLAGPREPLFESAPLTGPGGLLLTATAASARAAEARERHKRYPAALGEDMEAFGVALACHLFDVPLHVVRGASNPVGERDTSRWQIAPALEAAATLAQELLEPRATP